MKLTPQLDLFKIPEDVTYLNTASFSPAFRAIEEAGIKTVLEKNRPDLYDMGDFFGPITELRALFAQLIESDEVDRVVSIPSVSYGLANVANNLTLKPSDEILIIDEQFPSNYYIWEKLSKKYDATLKIIKAPETNVNRGKQWNQLILDSITENTALVTMGQVHWSNGVLFDLKAIREKTKLNGSLLVIDGSQTIGAFPFSVKEVHPDALIVAGYKWLFGPYGGAFGYYGSYFDNGNPIEENWINRLESENFSALTSYQTAYKPLAQRYGVGESSSFIYVHMRIAALKQIIEWGPIRIQEYCKELSVEAASELRKLGCYIENDEDRSHHMFGVEFPENLNIDSLKELLKANKVHVSFRGRFMRVSCHLFNTKSHFETLVKCVKNAIE